MIVPSSSHLAARVAPTPPSQPATPSVSPTVAKAVAFGILTALCVSALNNSVAFVTRLWAQYSQRPMGLHFVLDTAARCCLRHLVACLAGIIAGLMGLAAAVGGGPLAVGLSMGASALFLYVEQRALVDIWQDLYRVRQA
jgi:hypothetical protein